MKKIRTKNTDEGIITDSGITIDGDIAVSTGLELNSDRMLLIRGLIAFIACSCTMSILCSFIDCDNVALLPCLFVTLSFMAFRSSYSLFRIVGAGYIIFQASYFIITFNDIVNGFYVGLNRYMARAKISDSDVRSLVSKMKTIEQDNALVRFMIFAGVVVAVLTALGCIIRFDFAILFVGTFPFVEIGLYHGWDPPSLQAVALVSCWIIVVAIALINHSTNKAGRNNTFAVHRRKKGYFFTSNTLKNKFFTSYSVFVAIICCAVFVIVMLFSFITGFVRPKSFKTLRHNITEAVENFSFSSIQNLLADYDGGFDIFAIKSVGGTNGGRLGRKDGISFDGSTALDVKIAALPNYTVYLRGYVAGKYDDNCWDPISEDPDDDITDVFKDKGIPIQNFDHELYLNNIPEEVISKNDYNNIVSVAVIGASRRFAYAPYNADYNSDINPKNEKMQPTEEGYVKLKSKKYQLKYIDMALTSSDLFTSLYKIESRKDEYNHLNRVYSPFVYDNYLDTPSLDSLDEAVNEVREIAGNSISDDDLIMALPNYDLTNAAECALAIKEFFSRNGFVYDLNPGKTPSGRDFIDYFLEIKKGYCSYYATAGTMLMREFGFPARYVEGYVVTPGELQRDGATFKANVTDKAAHAWCEVFIDGAGWYPIEFTPGYNDNGNPNMTPDELNKNPGVTTRTTPVPPATTTTTTSATTSSSSSVTTKASGQTSKQTTTKKSVSDGNEGTGTGNGQGRGSGSEEDEGLSVAAKVIIADIVFVVMLILLFVLNRNLRLRKKNRQISLSDRNSAVKYIYVYYLRYLSLINISDNTNITDEHQAMKLITKCRKLQLESIVTDISRLSVLAIEAQHSNGQLTEDEYAFALEALNRLANEVVLDKLSFFGRVTSKWIFGLY